MSLGVVLDMKKAVVLNSLSMMEVLKSQSKDIYDIYISFVKYAISKTCKQNYAINIPQIIKFCNNKFALNCGGIIELICERLCDQKLLQLFRNSYNEQNYKLIYDLKDFAQDFDVKYCKCQSENDKLINDVYEYVSCNIPDRLTIKDFTLIFINFINENICYLEDSQILLNRNSDKSYIDYFIAQYILSKLNEEKYYFDRIKVFAKNALVANAIKNKAVINTTNLSELKVYLDAPIILAALGYKSESRNSYIQNMIKILKDNGAIINCFDHNLLEVMNIITKYFEGISNGQFKTKRLEYFESNIPNSSELIEINLNLSQAIKYGILKSKCGEIEVISAKKFNQDTSESIIFNENSFLDFVYKNSQSYIKSLECDQRINTDILSIESILVERDKTFSIKKQKIFDEINECNSLWLSDNLEFISITNSFLEKGLSENYFKKCIYSPAIFEKELSAYLFIFFDDESCQLSDELLINYAESVVNLDLGYLDSIIIGRQQLEKWDEQIIIKVREQYSEIKEIYYLNMHNPSMLNIRVVNKIDSIKKEIELQKQSVAENESLKNNIEMVIETNKNINKDISILSGELDAANNIIKNDFEINVINLCDRKMYTEFKKYKKTVWITLIIPIMLLIFTIINLIYGIYNCIQSNATNIYISITVQIITTILGLLADKRFHFIRTIIAIKYDYKFFKLENQSLLKKCDQEARKEIISSLSEDKKKIIIGV